MVLSTYPASKVLSYFFSAQHREARETLQNLCINSFEHARKLLSNCLFPRRRFNKWFPVRIKTGYKTSIKPEITHNYPSFWIVGSTKNIHKFCRVSIASPCHAEKKYERTLLAGYYLQCLFLNIIYATKFSTLYKKYHARFVVTILFKQ